MTDGVIPWVEEICAELSKNLAHIYEHTLDFEGETELDLVFDRVTHQFNALIDENRRLRRMLCVASCSGAYMDDGEAQDNSAGIDYLRDSLDQIQTKKSLNFNGQLAEIGLKRFSDLKYFRKVIPVGSVAWSKIQGTTVSYYPEFDPEIMKTIYAEIP